jgi:3-deoxy-D-manno-octulosonic-acid transferase
MKFESVEVDTQKLNTLRKQYLPYLKKETNKLLICGSTHYPEEEIILDIYKEICEKNPTWRLLIAPRHIDRIGIIEKSISERGLSPIKISEIDQSSMGTNTVFLLDTIGELKYFYAFADICFVGGSLADYGGHNLLEPIFFAKPTIFGPHTDNFKDISRTILEKRAGILVKDRSEFKKILIELISDTQLQKEISLSCLHVFEEEKNSVEENLKLVLTCIK